MMSPWVLFTVLVASSTWFSSAEAAPCAEICSTTELTGFGPGGIAGCSCSGSRPTRSGPGGCSCGQCYQETNGAIIGYAVSSDGTCAYGTDCGDCTNSLDSSLSKSTTSPSSTAPTPTLPTTSSSSTSTVTDAPATLSAPPVLDTLLNATSETSSSSTDQSNSPTTTTTSSTLGSDNSFAGEIAGSFAPNTSDGNGLKTWQIALIICCGVLFFTVAVVSVLSCYCKARNRLYENEDNQADASYYQQQHVRQHGDVVGSDAIPTPTLFPTSTISHRRSGSLGSLINEVKPMYANSANSNSSDRLGSLAPVHMRSSSGDLAGMAGNSYPNAGSFPNERNLSGSYPMDRRPSSNNRSQGRQLNLEPRNSNRDLLAVEL